MIFRKLILGPLGTNCYIFGSEKSKEIVIIDPGAQGEEIIKNIKELNAKPIGVLLTHGHFDHTMKVGKILRVFQIPLMFNKKEFDSGIYNQKSADRWLQENDIVEVGELRLHVLETPGHSPGSLCFYSNDVKEFKEYKIDGVIFTGDLLFRRSVGRTDVFGGDQDRLFQSIREKIMHNKNLSDNFIAFPGHMGTTSIGEERNLNMFREFFL